MAYFKNILEGLKTTKVGMSLTWKHLWQAKSKRTNFDVGQLNALDINQGHVTLQFPFETLAVPENGRYQLDCEIDDCIVCDKCAKICPVDCIDISVIKSPGVINYTSDGSPIRLYAETFDIDMAKCCFCGLCTTVCPTDCLTMTSTYDFSKAMVEDLNFVFSKLTKTEADEKRALYDQFLAEKEATKAQITKQKPLENAENVKPVFRPTQKPTIKAEEPSDTITPKANPPFKPSFKPTLNPEEPQAETNADQKVAFKPSFKPSFKPAVKAEETKEEANVEQKSAFKPSFKPTIKPTVKTEEPKEEANVEQKSAFKPSFKPTIKPTVKTEVPKEEANVEQKAAFKPSFKPTIKPAVKAENTDAINDQEIESTKEELQKPKPSFKPTYKPK